MSALNLNDFSAPGIDLCGGGSAPGTGGRMEIHRMDHRAVSGILDVDIHGVADANAQHRPGNAAVEVQ